MTFLAYIKKVVGIASTTPSNTLIQRITPEYQCKCDKNENCGSYTTLLRLGASFGVPFQLQAKPKACRSPHKQTIIIPSLIKITVQQSKILAVLLLASLSLLVARPLLADSISTTNKYAWSENAGWLDFSSTHEQVSVYDDHLEGYVWSESVGWIRLGTYTAGDAHTYTNDAANTYGVNNDGNGNLSGYAWSENAGWIHFNPTHSQVTINTTTGDFDGYAWSEALGWIHFQHAAPAYKVTRIASSANYVPDSGNPGGSIVFSATGQTFSGISITTADGSKPSGTTAPFGKISYQVTSPNGGTATVALTFSTALPSSFSVYKVDNAGVYSLIPQDSGADGFWHQVDANTLEITLKDGGAFDLDNAANGSILDPIVILINAVAPTNIPTLSFWGLLLMIAMLSFVGRKKSRLE
ncbi:MAG: hypothetical protein QM504_13765 [Pseudomonadota bacterium]